MTVHPVQLVDFTSSRVSQEQRYSNYSKSSVDLYISSSFQRQERTKVSLELSDLREEFYFEEEKRKKYHELMSSSWQQNYGMSLKV